jgi:hypothetical protein
MSHSDFTYLNIPALLGRKAWLAVGAEKEGLTEDLTWRERFAARLFNLVLFFRNNGLLKIDVPQDISNFVLRFSDFTEEGQRFIKSGAPDKWLASFDRDPTKSSEDVSYLTRRLASVRKKL